LRSDLEAIATGLPIRFMGQLSSTDAQSQIAGAKLLILPSEWFEGFPMVVREAFAFGTPAAVSNLGPLPSIVQHGESGVVFEAANPESLLHKVRDAWNNQGLLEQLGKGARREFETKYTEDANYAALTNIYEQALAVSKARPT
jgi:glycosyltransferase involved in cell wall biosynthesis